MNQNINKFAALAGLIKNVKRTGWLRYLPKEVVQSVGDHSAKTALLSLFLRGSKQIDYTKCLQIALIHDIAQGIVGDYTPHDSISKQQKNKQEHEAMKKILSPLGQSNAQFFQKLWLQYEQSSSFEALIVKDLDKLQMIQQAFAYQQKYGVNLGEFYGCVPQMKTDLVRGWAEDLLAERSIYLAQKKE